jgi:hypothetical protein
LIQSGPLAHFEPKILVFGHICSALIVLDSRLFADAFACCCAATIERGGRLGVGFICTVASSWTCLLFNCLNFPIFRSSL